MIKRFTGIVGALLLTVALTTFTASALAGNGHGNGNSQATTAGQVSASTATSTHGNSANAPGHANASSSTSASSSVSGNANTSAQAGVKPANNTAKGTSCRTGGTGSAATCTASNGVTASNTVSASRTDASKRYGNGRTAAQIANSHGLVGSNLIGPGNSQPHKVTSCRHPAHGNGGGVDVHAVKGASGQSCVSTGVTSGTTVIPTLGATTTVSTAAVATSGGLLGAIATQLAVKAGLHGSHSGGVLGANASVRGGVLGALAAKRTGTLPFTGFPIWAVALAGLALMALGFGVRRQGRGRVTI